MVTSHQELIQALYQIGVVQFGQFTLKSQQASPVYINLRKIISYPKLLQHVADAMWSVIKDCQFDLICGVPYTALPIATCIALTHDIPMVMRRKEKKDYGTKQVIEGDFKSGQRCLVIEDIVTTGSSVLETITELEIVGLHVLDVALFIDREQGGKENLSTHCRVHSVMSLSTVLQTLHLVEHQ